MNVVVIICSRVFCPIYLARNYYALIILYFIQVKHFVNFKKIVQNVFIKLLLNNCYGNILLHFVRTQIVLLPTFYYTKDDHKHSHKTLRHVSGRS